MRLKSRLAFSNNPDMTPMLDCTFQLTFFFMLTLNFSSDVQSELIRLPVSEVAKPAEGSSPTRVTIQTLASGQVLFGGDQMEAAALRGSLRQERDMLMHAAGRDITEATVVVRADRNAPVGKVQEVMRICQDSGFTKFVLRARLDPGKYGGTAP